MAVRRLLILACLSAVVVGKVAKTRPCDLASVDKCTVGEVRIDPCNGQTSACGLVKGKNATISFEFTPNFTASSLKTGAFYMEKAFADLEADSDACKLTTCPSVPGQQQTLNYNLYVGKKLPKGIFNIKWMVWDADNADTNYCCFMTSIKLPIK